MSDEDCAAVAADELANNLVVVNAGERFDIPGFDGLPAPIDPQREVELLPEADIPAIRSYVQEQIRLMGAP